MRQQQLMTDLESNLQTLRKEVQELELQRHLIYHGVPTKSNNWSVAAEFFRLFRSSVKPTTTSATTDASDFNVQRSFLASTMSPDVTDGAVCGVDALLEAWAAQSNGPGNLLVAAIKGTLVINENTLRFAFPHLVEEYGRWSNLADRMLGQRLVLRGSVHFEWDRESCRVSSVVCRADVLTPLMKLFGSLDDVALISSNARLDAEGRLVSSEGLQAC
ncbi:unnamed protein product [Phytophthora lilii]|uniref:Unnamed protein product n=1 Tax=Phytophthora lilii TaxID=2077276 RepID=A0A9W7DD54_9STRA|nr:unnamed protein product [Phytophthora lilii]